MAAVTLRHVGTYQAHKSSRIGESAKALVAEERLTLALGSQPYWLDEPSR